MENINFEKSTAKYHQLKVKRMVGESLADKEQAFISFYESSLLKPGLSTDDREVAQTQLNHLFNTLFKE